jgi:low-density lipoprotein receptor-related protein 4
VLTFSNPNYNGADALAQAQAAAADQPSSSSSSRSTIWKRFKYDRAQERVYEEKFLGIPETATTTLISGGGITPSPVHPSPVLGLPTIG